MAEKDEKPYRKRRRKRTHKGKFRPSKPKKYVGNVNEIVYRSGWELQFMMLLDANDTVQKWASEELIIRYFDPVSNRVRRYFPDFIVEQTKPDKTIEKKIIEIKPMNEVVKPVRRKGQRMATFMEQTMTYTRNQAKWRYAKKWAEANGFKFYVVTKSKNDKFIQLTEKDLGLE